MADPDYAEAYEEFGKELNLAISLAEARESRHMTQRELAELSGIKQPMLARIERGQMPNLVTIAKIAAALNAAFTINPDGRTYFTMQSM